MTEAEWLTCTDPRRMLGLLNVRRASPRKLRLFVCACRRQGIHLPSDEPWLREVELAERFADGELVTGDDLVTGDAAALASATVAPQGGGRVDRHAGLIRDIFGYPFRPLPPPGGRAAALWERELDSALRGNNGLLLGLAQTAYDDRRSPEGTVDGARLAVLADALEEAGCINPDLLGHLRRSEAHVRGCWALDLLLGRS